MSESQRVWGHLLDYRQIQSQSSESFCCAQVPHCLPLLHFFPPFLFFFPATCLTPHRLINCCRAVAVLGSHLTVKRAACNVFACNSWCSLHLCRFFFPLNRSFFVDTHTCTHTHIYVDVHIYSMFATIAVI